MNRILPIVFAALTVLLVVVGSAGGGVDASPSTPEGAVHSMFDRVRARDWNGALQHVSKSSNSTAADLSRELGGANASLKTYSSLEKVETSVLHHNDREALVRANFQYSSAVGALADLRDLKVVREGDAWKVEFPVQKPPKVPPQVIPVNYLRWDVITRGADDDWGAQNVDPPKIRITSMNAVERDGGITVLGELVNEDTVPGFVAVGALLIGQNGETLAEETAFDKMNHTVLPKEVTPFRIDFPGLKLAQVKSVRMQPNSMLVPASADPVIGVLHQRLEKDWRGKRVLKGELVNQSGQTVNIPHVIATFYDNTGKIVWVQDGFVSNALLPNTPEPFQVPVRDDLGDNIQYRVIVNHYSLNRAGM